MASQPGRRHGCLVQGWAQWTAWPGGSGEWVKLCSVLACQFRTFFSGANSGDYDVWYKWEFGGKTEWDGCGSIQTRGVEGVWRFMKPELRWQQWNSGGIQKHALVSPTFPSLLRALWERGPLTPSLTLTQTLAVVTSRNKRLMTNKSFGTLICRKDQGNF